MQKDRSEDINKDIETQILQDVSRSFALTIPELPLKLGRTVTNAYLLCRIVDTIEDESDLSIDQKRFFFHKFIDVVNKNDSAEKFAGELHPLLGNETLPAEKELIKNTPVVIGTYFSLSPQQQTILKRCIIKMSNGMLKFQEIKSPCGLENFSHMQGYCYHVAGVVGEMLTDLFCDYSVEIAKNRDKLFNLAASFGQGLQMTNILKDLWEDRELGVCWLPKDVFKSVGFDLTHLKPGAYTPSFGNGLEKLIGITNMHLNNALRYTILIPKHESGIRKFCLWAIGMAILTLRNINRNHQYTSGNDVKISRKDVKKVIGVSNVALRSNFLLRMSFRFAARGLPITSPLKPFTQPLVTQQYKDQSKEYQRNAD